MKEGDAVTIWQCGTPEGKRLPLTGVFIVVNGHQSAGLVSGGEKNLIRDLQEGSG